MRLIVSDSSCLIDLHKGLLIESFLSLPYDILIPDTLFEDELLSFTRTEKQALKRGGLKVTELPGDGVQRAQEVLRQFPQISVHDGFAFVLAESHDGCILATGDAYLRKAATQHNIEVHGVLWIIDQLHEHGAASRSRLRAALQRFAEDPTVHLPKSDLAAYLKRYA